MGNDSISSRVGPHKLIRPIDKPTVNRWMPVDGPCFEQVVYIQLTYSGIFSTTRQEAFGKGERSRKCPECIVDVMHAQVSLHFRAVETGSDDYLEAPVIAGICPKCGRMEFNMATPGQFKIWLDSQRTKARAGGTRRT